MGRRTPEQRERLRARYMHRKLNGLCVKCGAGLQPDDGVRCVECTELAQLYQLRHLATPSGHRKNLERHRAYYRADPEMFRERQRMSRLERKAAGICIECTEPASDTSVRCEQHRLDHAERNRRMRAARAAGVAMPGRKSVKPVKPKLARQRDAANDNESRETMADRALRFMRWADWSSTRDIGDALEFDVIERNNLSNALIRMQRAGLVESRGDGPTRDWRLTPAGLAEADRLRGMVRAA